MAKNKKTSKEVKSKVPFNVFRKGAMALAVAGVMIASPLMLTGCAGEKGDIGPAGATWYSGTQYSTENGNIGDFFYDTDDCNIYQKTNDGWTLISNIKGEKGVSGAAWLTGNAVTGTGTSITATVADARVGDLYLNNSGDDAGNLYKCKAVNTWEYITNINGTDGQTPAAPKVEIKNDYWYIDDEPTGIKAEGEDGYTPQISIIGGKWAINGVPTNQDAQGVKGDRGSVWLTGSLVTGTGSSIEKEVDGAIVGDLYLNNTGTDAGNLYICKAANTWEFLININGETPVVPEIKIQDGKWYVGGDEKGPAVGKDGTVITIKDGYWALDGVKTSTLARGEKGDRGATWSTGEGAPTATNEDIANDMYLDTANNVIYQYNGTAWNPVSTLKLAEVLENYYYTVHTEAELLKLIEKGAKCFKLGQDVTLTKQIAPKTDMNFDLNKHTLAYNGETSADRLEIHAQKEKPINIVFKNGIMNFTNEDGAATIVIDTGCSITLENVHYTSNTTALYPRRDTTKVEVINSTIEAVGFAVGTNASLVDGVPVYKGIEIVLKDSILKTNSEDFDNTAVMINVPGSLNIENCEITGDKQAVIARGGDTVIKNSKLICTGEYLKANPNYQYQPIQDDFNQYTFTTWATGNAVPCGTLVVGNNNSSAYQYVTNIELHSTQIVSNRITTPRIVAIGNETPQDADYIGVNVLMNGIEYDVEFMFTSVLGENLNIRSLVHSYEELETVIDGMEYGFNVVPVLSRDLANYSQNLYVEDYMFIKEELIPYLAEQKALNGYSIYTPIFEAMMQYQVKAMSTEGIDYAINTLKSYRVMLDKDILLTDDKKYAEYQTLISQERLIKINNNGVYLVQEVSTEQQLLEALTNVERGVLDKVILTSNISVCTYNCAEMYQDYTHKITTYEDDDFSVTINSTLSATVGTESELMEICENAQYLGCHVVNVTLTEQINLTSTVNNNTYMQAMSSGSVSILSGEYYVMLYFEEREVSTEEALITCLQDLQNGNYVRPKLMENITLTSVDSNNIYNQMSEAVITNGFTVTIYSEGGEDPITYTQVGTRSAFIELIQNAPVGENVYIQLTDNIQLESVEDNIIVSEFMQSDYVFVKRGPTDSEYNILPYIDESAIEEVSTIEDVLALIEGKDVATSEPIYIKLTQDILISAENQEKLYPWMESGKLIPATDEYTFITEG
ncbi:MAG: hypothetical protein E7351_02705 [Clostridiales bacterium]|nr:hypothetical protein [Clostridiales bacterium]